MKTFHFAAIVALAATLAACGQEAPSAAPAAPPKAESAPPAAAQPAPAPVAAAPANPAGQSVYNRTCALCHAAGVAGAPKPGDKEEWAPRIAQGMDVLYKHAAEGFTGQKGMMPARGGAPTLSDDDLKAAVDHMVNKSK